MRPDVLLCASIGLSACCIPGGEPDREVLAEADLACGAITAHVRRVHVVTNRLEGVSVTVREVAFGEGAAIEADAGHLAPWRPREELPEHARRDPAADDDGAWLLAIPRDAEYRCLAEHLAEIEDVFEDGRPVVVFHAEHDEVAPTFRARRGDTDLTLGLSPDGSLFVRLARGASENGVLIGQMLREPDGRVLALARGPIPAMASYPPDFREASSVVAVARDARGRALLDRFPSQTRLVDLTEVPGLR